MVERINKLLVPSIILTAVFYAAMILASALENSENPIVLVFCMAAFILGLVCMVINIIICFYTHAAGVFFKKIVMWPIRAWSLLGVIPMVVLFFVEYSFVFTLPFAVLLLARMCAVR